MSNLIVAPVVIPLLTAIMALLFYRQRRVQRMLGVAGSAALLGAGLALFVEVWRSGIVMMQMGNWPAPFGITFIADLFSALMVLMAGMLGLMVTLYSLATINVRREMFGYYPLLQILLMGVCGAFLTGDLFNLYVWFEVLLIASFVLLALGGERGQLEGGIKYVTLNLVSSVFFLTAIGILYAEAGTLNMADLARRLPQLPEQGLITALAMLFLVAFGIKAAIFPLFFWLPASYHTPPFAVSALFAGLLTKVGVYALIRTFTLIFVHDVGYTHTLILVACGLTMVTGVLGAIAQNELRRILSFLIVSHIGFAILGLGLFTPFALAGSVFYVIEDMIVLTALFMASGAIHEHGGSEELQRLGGLYQRAPGLALLFLVPALSLSGIPPLSGFFAKLALLQAGLEGGQYLIVATMLVVSVLTLYTVMQIWSEVFWKPAPGGPRGSGVTKRRHMILLRSPIVVLVAAIVTLGLTAGPVFGVATRAAEQLADPATYVESVLEAQP